MELKENPLVSVVIPMFNAEDWIVGLMHSILNQSYKNIEVISDPSLALPGRKEPMQGVPEFHYVHTESKLKGPWPSNYELMYFGMGCFWGAERAFWKHPGVHSTSVGYMGGFTPNPTYEEVCSGKTQHNEVV